METYGTNPLKRDINTHIRYGVVNLDKPAGITSRQATEKVKEILGSGKAGHSGTLDPNVTGVLPIFLDESTKIVRAVLEASKEYTALARFHKEISPQQLKKTIKKFTGKIRQLPPVKSSVKRVERERSVYKITPLEFDGQNFRFRVECQAGTYIRKLIHDMGEFAKVKAHMVELRRIKAGPFTEETNLVTIEELKKATGNETLLRKYVLPVESAVSHLKRIYISDGAVDSICHGATPKMPGVEKFDDNISKGELIALFTMKGELIAIATAKMSSNYLRRRKRGVAAKLERVILPVGTYPKNW